MTVLLEYHVSISFEGQTITSIKGKWVVLFTIVTINNSKNNSNNDNNNNSNNNNNNNNSNNDNNNNNSNNNNNNNINTIYLEIFTVVFNCTGLEFRKN